MKSLGAIEHTGSAWNFYLHGILQPISSLSPWNIFSAVIPLSPGAQGSTWASLPTLLPSSVWVWALPVSYLVSTPWHLNLGYGGSCPCPRVNWQNIFYSHFSWNKPLTLPWSRITTSLNMDCDPLRVTCLSRVGVSRPRNGLSDFLSLCRSTAHFSGSWREKEFNSNRATGMCKAMDGTPNTCQVHTCQWVFTVHEITNLKSTVIAHEREKQIPWEDWKKNFRFRDFNVNFPQRHFVLHKALQIM